MAVQYSISQELARSLVEARAAKGISQRRLADMIGRGKGRVAELERDLALERPIRDRLSVFLDACDVLGVVPVLVPRSRVLDVCELLKPGSVGGSAASAGIPNVLDELFVDLGEGEED
jgi:transcriptional regulator with XRE-family HTH domain